MQDKNTKNGVGSIWWLGFGSVGRVWNIGLGLRFGGWCGVVAFPCHQTMTSLQFNWSLAVLNLDMHEIC